MKSLCHTSLSLLLACSLIFALACDSAKLAKNADRAAKAFTQVQPVIQSLIDGHLLPGNYGSQILARLTEGASTATLLAAAFRSGDNQTALDLTAKVIQVLQQLIDEDAQLLPAGVPKVTILAILATAQIALSIIADNIGPAPAMARSQQSVQVIEAFRRGPRLRCRSSIDGQFHKMDYCRANPATSVVESVKQ